jgi:uncharacterized membrane protein YfhO
VHNEAFSKLSTIPDTAPLPSSTNILNMLNVKYILTVDKINDPTCRLRSKGEEFCLYENLNFLPRAYIVQKYNVIKDELAIANRLKSKDFQPQEEAVLEEEPKLNSVKGPAIPGKEEIDIIKYMPQEVVIRANILHNPKIILLADIYYPGWKAFIDGKEDKIYKANFCLRAVYLAPGEHLVRFSYEPASFKIGLGISLTTAFILLLALFMLKYRHA